jgi:hypothetical protein
MTGRKHWNATRYDGSGKGHYESFFQRANHPTEPRAFWIRYTIFSPKGRPDQGLGELWAISFDGIHSKIVAVRQTAPIRECSFSSKQLSVKIGAAELDQTSLSGSATHDGHTVDWDLSYTSPERPLLLLDQPLYTKGFPKAKALVGSPQAAYTGTVVVDGESLDIDGWIGSQNHNWGSKHTDAYVWGQVAGFDGAPEAFLECSTARIKIGPLWTPRFTVVVLRVGDDEYALNTLGQALRGSARYDYFTWTFDSRKGDVWIHGRIEAPATAFVGLTYLDPPGGSRTCLNSKIARCELTLERAGHPDAKFVTENRAAFEIITNDTAHGVRILV